MEYIDDLSFDNITNMTQGDETKGSDILHVIALEMEDNNKTIKELERELKWAKNRKSNLIEASKYVMGEIRRECPLAIIKKDYIVVVTEKSISIERNVI